MSLTHHFPESAATINGWLAKSGFPHTEENAVRVAIELGTKTVNDANLDAAWKAVQAKPAPAAVDARSLSAIPARAMVEALRLKIEAAPRGTAKGQMRTALDGFVRASGPWLSFEGK